MADGKVLGWRIEQQYVRNHRGDVICQWGSYTSRRNAALIARAPDMAALLRALERDHPAIVAHARAALATSPAASPPVDP